MPISQTPWRRGIGNDCHTVFDAQGSVVADRVGTSDGDLIAAAPALRDMLLELRGRSIEEGIHHFVKLIDTIVSGLNR